MGRSAKHRYREPTKIKRLVQCVCPTCRCEHTQYLIEAYIRPGNSNSVELTCPTCAELYSQALRIRVSRSGQPTLPFGPLE